MSQNFQQFIIITSLFQEHNKQFENLGHYKATLLHLLKIIYESTVFKFRV